MRAAAAAASHPAWPPPTTTTSHPSDVSRDMLCVPLQSRSYMSPAESHRRSSDGNRRAQGPSENIIRVSLIPHGFLLDLLRADGYPALAVLVGLECVGLPLPGE